MDEQVLKIEDLSILYKTDLETVYAVNGIGFSLKEGETMGLVGETGAGKTTTALGILGLLPERTARITGGKILFDGQDICGMKEQELQHIRGQKISMIFQDPMTALNPVLTVGEQIGEALYLHNQDELSQKEIEQKVEETLELVGIPRERKKEYPYQFSGGMRQRVVIAIALVCNPKLLIADEPTTALDVTIQAQILSMICDLQRKYGTSVIMITHDLGVVAETCDKVGIMYAGEMVEYGSLDDIFTGEKHHPYTEGLFGSIPSLTENSRRLHPIEGLMPDPTHLPEGCKFAPRCTKCREICHKEKPGVYENGDHKIRCHLFAGERKNASIQKDAGIQENESILKGEGIQECADVQKNENILKGEGIQKCADVQKNVGIQKDAGIQKNEAIQKDAGIQKDAAIRKNESILKDEGIQWGGRRESDERKSGVTVSRNDQITETLLDVKHLKKYFKTTSGMLHAVDDVTFTIPRGKTMGVVGESGCGKSTLGRTLLQLYEPTEGEILFHGKNIANLTKKELQQTRPKMQMIFQDPYSSLNGRMTVQQLIAEPLIVNKVCKNKKEIDEKVARMMETVGLASRLSMAYPHELDGGRRQRIGVARALILDPEFVVCDEPVSALDVSIQAQILNLLMDLQEQMGLTYMFITHDLSVVKHISDEIMVMYLGKCVEQAPADEIFRNPVHPYTKALLAAIPIPSVESCHKRRELLQGEVASPVNPKPGCRFAARCPMATNACRQEDIPLRKVAPGHYAACVRV